MRVAVAGLGDIARAAHVPALVAHPGIELVQLVDPEPARRAAMAGVGVPVAETVDVGAVDGVVLATPPWVTPELVVEFARAGLFVLAEKPVATSVEAAKIYEQLTAAERARVQVGLTYRHDPAIAQLTTWIADGTLGSPVLIRAHIYDEQFRPDDAEHTARITATLEHGMPVVHEGAHVFDWLTHLLGAPPIGLDDAWSVRTRPGLPAPNLVGGRLSYPGGHQALVEFGWLTSALPRCELTVLGDRGLAVLDGFTFDLKLVTAEGERVVRFPGDRMTRCFERQLNRFVALSVGGPAEPSLDDGIAALQTAQLLAGRAG
ncbi:Gfo/Idh/MocA family oxidoreductase [Kribbella sandramycini]|uniref:Gfo/Idh/MocA family oxidoreductase n=1 Tax=Kribbella sandramycini TaxID=60450 RepID=A0A7Y4KV60_9ACTN|nr:Gfo/Idh/MocA family oxidoreductase [Kribbella sandramycini]MBB6568262.1 putative dehydrogenase [Kribbella sandramycini]NOL39145.1 Gfo/Idh/MocA family oxidoreductase [Kribbella sandramycini]